MITCLDVPSITDCLMAAKCLLKKLILILGVWDIISLGMNSKSRNHALNNTVSRHILTHDWNFCL